MSFLLHQYKFTITVLLKLWSSITRIYCRFIYNHVPSPDDILLETKAEFERSDWGTDFPLLAQSHFIFSPKMVRVKFIHNMLFHLGYVTQQSKIVTLVFQGSNTCRILFKKTLCGKITGIFIKLLMLKRSTTNFCSGSTMEIFNICIT